jgi:hypothetical protein
MTDIERPYDKGRAALDRWSRSETRPRKSRRKA